MQPMSLVIVLHLNIVKLINLVSSVAGNEVMSITFFSFEKNNMKLHCLSDNFTTTHKKSNIST